MEIILPMETFANGLQILLTRISTKRQEIIIPFKKNLM